MPEFDFALVLFPAKKNFLSIPQRRKINQPALQIFNLNFARLKFLRHGWSSARTLIEALTVSPPTSLPMNQTAQPHVELRKSDFERLNFPKPFANLRQQSPRFFQRVMFGKFITHKVELA